MKKRLLAICLTVLVIMTIIPCSFLGAEAASNPYPTSQTINGITTLPCTRYAWQQAYDRLGINMPAWGNAISWLTGAKNSGYATGETPLVNSIAVWSVNKHDLGHVAFVTAVSGTQMTVNEGGRSDYANQSNGIVNGQVLPSSVNSTWYGRTLLGFIYLNQTDDDVINYNGAASTSAKGLYLTVADSVIIRSTPSSSGTQTGSVAKGDIIEVVSSGKNLAGNTWYKLSDGCYTYPDISGTPRYKRITDAFAVIKSDAATQSKYSLENGYINGRILPNSYVSGAKPSAITSFGVILYTKSGSSYTEVARGTDTTPFTDTSVMNFWYNVSQNPTSSNTKFYNNGVRFMPKAGTTYYYKIFVNYSGKSVVCGNYANSSGYFSFVAPGSSVATTYTISYNANGGSGAPSSQTKTKDVTLTLSSTKPTRTGYSFLGWSTSSTATSASYSAGSSFTSNANTTLYAVWKANTYTVSYNANGGSGAPSSQTKAYGVTLYLSSTVPTRSGYTFLGWSTSSSAASATYSAGGSFTANADTTLYAVWKANTYTVSYNANGGSGAPSSQTKTYGVTLTLSSTKPTRSGYTFLGWSTSSTATSATYSAGGSFTTNANTTLYAVWKANTYTVSYNANGGSGAPSSQTKTYGVTLYLSSTVPTRSGYTFLGWSTSSSAASATYSAGGSFTANADTTLYAVWKANTYTVSYNANGGSGALSSQTKTHGVTLTLSSTVPTRSGYTFLGWSTSSTATSATYSAGGSFTSNANTTLYAVWKSNHGTYGSNHLCLCGCGAWDPNLQDTVAYSKSITIKATTNNALGYGPYAVCSDNDAYFHTGDTITANGHVINLYGNKWYVVSYNGKTYYADGGYFEEVPETYTVSYNANGGSGAPSSQTKTHGVTLTLSSAVPTRSGYTFLGWSTSSTATSATYSAGGSFTSNANTTLYAVWKKNEDTSSKFDVVVSAPATYSASGEFEVLVYIRNIKVNGGLSRVSFTFSYDSNSLTLLNTVNSDNSVDCAKKMPSSWENVSTASAGKINVFYMNMTDSVTVSADDGIILSFKFKAKSTASSDLTFTVSAVEGSDYPNPDVTLKGTGSSAKTVYVAYMLGDINGNGKIDALDYGLLKRACLGTYTLTDVQKLAGDINGNGKIEALDYGLLKRACLGTYTIK